MKSNKFNIKVLDRKEMQKKLKPIIVRGGKKGCGCGRG